MNVEEPRKIDSKEKPKAEGPDGEEQLETAKKPKVAHVLPTVKEESDNDNDAQGAEVRRRGPPATNGTRSGSNTKSSAGQGKKRRLVSADSKESESGMSDSIHISSGHDTDSETEEDEASPPTKKAKSERFQRKR